MVEAAPSPWNAANALTVLRIVLVPVFVVALMWDHGQTTALRLLALALFVVAAVTDRVDGWLARRNNLVTDFGKLMDSIADKLLMVSVFIMLAWLDLTPDWIVFLAVTRDALIVGAFLVSNLIGNPIKVAPLMISKINTAVQIVLIVTVLSDQAFSLGLVQPVTVLLYLAALLTIASGASYLVLWMRHVAASK